MTSQQTDSQNNDEASWTERARQINLSGYSDSGGWVISAAQSEKNGSLSGSLPESDPSSAESEKE